jgi:gamma-glutamylcyclotransferase (GGCT)/AIG2-like uncharacterized protein YtfP
MPRLFSYGTLQQEAVQLSSFGRRLDGLKDELPGYRTSLVQVTDPGVIAASGLTHHKNAIFTGRAEDRVPGTVFEVTEAEILKADHYERLSGYRRIEAVLVSGTKAILYIHPSETPT